MQNNTGAGISPHPPRMALLACQVFQREIALLAAGAKHIVETRFFEIGLHDRPDHLRAILQAELNALARREDIEAVALAYGLCGRGSAGLRSCGHPLVIPRAHDCITVFMGSKEAFAERQRRCPGCYYYTPGWNRARRVPGPDRLQWLKEELHGKFDIEDAEYLLENERQQWAAHHHALYIDLGTPDAEREAEYAESCALWLGWEFQRLKGDFRLLRDLLWGNWDAARFEIAAPGQRLVHSPDENILGLEAAGEETPAK